MRDKVCLEVHEWTWWAGNSSIRTARLTSTVLSYNSISFFIFVVVNWTRINSSRLYSFIHATRRRSLKSHGYRQFGVGTWRDIRPCTVREARLIRRSVNTDHCTALQNNQYTVFSPRDGIPCARKGKSGGEAQTVLSVCVQNADPFSECATFIDDVFRYVFTWFSGMFTIECFGKERSIRRSTSAIGEWRDVV